MKLQRFFVETQVAGTKELEIADKNLIHQWRDVFRMKAGDSVVLLDNTGFEYPSKFITLEKGKAILEILDKVKNEVTPKREVALYQAVIKKDKFEWIVQKCTELGVSEIVPVISERSEKKNLNMERLAAIAKEAAEQSGRGELPKLLKLQKLPELLKNFKEDGIVFDSSGISFESVRSTFYVPRLAIFIGPEGGWSERELETFKSKNIPIVSLGDMTLRAETAAIAVTTLLLIQN